MNTATEGPTMVRPTSLGDAPVMHEAVASRTTSKALMTVVVNDVPVKRGTVVFAAERPLWVGQVIRVTADPLIYVRWINTRTLVQESTVELPDPTLHWFVPTFDRKRAA